MAGAQANVALTISLNGADNASDAIERAQKALGGLEARAGKVKTGTGDMTKAGEDGLKNLREKSGDVESALKGVSDFAGKGKEQLSLMGDAFGGVEAIMRLLPGQAGLIATGIAGAALGAKLLYDHLQQSEAKLRLLASADAKKLGEQLGFGADQTVKVSKALSDLGTTLAPTSEIMQRVAANAKAMGADIDGQAAAVAQFVAAWKEGPEAVRKVQIEVGDLGFKFQTVVQAAQQLGLNIANLGLADMPKAVEEAKTKLIEYQRLQGAIAATETAIAAEQKRRQGDLSAVQQAQAAEQIANLQRVLASQRQQLDNVGSLTRSASERNDVELRLADVSREVAEIDKNTEARASAARTKEIAAGIRLEGLMTARTELAKQLAQWAGLAAIGAGKEAEEHARSLADQIEALNIKEKGIIAADREEQKAKAREASAQAAANRQAIREAGIATLRAKADLDGEQSYQERLALIDAEQKAATASANEAIKNAKVRAAKIAQIDAEAATKRAALDRDFQAQYDKATEAGAKATQDGMAKTAERVKAANDAMAADARARASVEADAARQAGNDAQAAEIERLAAHADYAAQMKAIDEELARMQDPNEPGSVVAGSLDAQALQTVAEAKRVQAKRALDAVERKIDQDKRDRDLQARAAAADVLSQVGDTYQALGQLGNVYAGAFGKSLNVAVAGFKNLDKAMTDSKSNAEDVSQAVGQLATGIAASWIDAEAQRTAKQLDAEEQRALSTATTEEQRAAVTAEFEAKKAKAVQDAEREKAAILALMEIANAAASYPNIPAMVAHGAAAALYGAVAGGIIGGSSSAAAPSMPAGGGFAAKQASGGGQGGVQGGGATVYNFFGVYGTKQQLGKTMAEANRAMASSGYRGKGV